MRGMNVCEIIGNLGGSPEMRYTPTGRAVTNFRVAVNRRWRDAEGQVQEKVEWFRVVAWNRLAELANTYLDKGNPVYVRGRLETRSFEGADGQVRYLTEVVAQDLILLPRGNGNGNPVDETAEIEEEEPAEIPL
jgi:single-strand DNA-binding protein